MSKTQIKTKKGVTLIVLVITIILIMILAGVTLGIVSQDDGLIATADKQAVRIENDEEFQQLKIEITKLVTHNIVVQGTRTELIQRIMLLKPFDENRYTVEAGKIHKVNGTADEVYTIYQLTGIDYPLQ